MKRDRVPEPTARKSAAVLNDLIEVSRDGERFYMDAAKKVDRPELKELFQEMAAVHQGLIDDLGDHVLERGEAPSDHRTLTGTAQQIFADAIASVAANEPTYVAQLEQAEDRLLERYRAALMECTDDPVRAVLAEHLPTIEASHRRMKRLKELYRG